MKIIGKKESHFLWVFYVLSWKLSEKKKVIFYDFFMSFWIRVEIIARKIFHNLDKNKTVWIQNVNNWCSTTETRTHKFWSFTPVWNKNASWKLSEKKKVIFYDFFMSFWIRVELIAREIFHNLDKNKTVWIQNMNNWCSTTETITYKFWSFTPVWNKNALWKLSEKKKVISLWLFYVLLN